MNLQQTAMVASALLTAACGGGDASGDTTMGATESGSGNGPTSGTGTIESSSTESGVDTTGTGQDTPDTDQDTTEGSGETGDAPGLEVVVLPSSVAVLEEDEMGELTVDCMLTDNGVPVVDPGAFSVALSPNKGVRARPGPRRRAHRGASPSPV